MVVLTSSLTTYRVLEGDGAGFQRGRRGSHDDGVACRDGEAGKGVGVVGVPLVPSILNIQVSA